MRTVTLSDDPTVILKSDPAPDRSRRAAVHAALGDEARLALVEELLLSDLTPQEAGRMLSLRSSLLAHHVNVLEAANVVTRSRSAGDGRRRYLSVNRSVVDGLVKPPEVSCRSVVFVCTHNAARSQLAEALWREASDIPVASAGTNPVEQVNPGAVEAGREIGLELDGHPKLLSEINNKPDLVITVCDLAHENELHGVGHRRLHWSLPDPSVSPSPDAFGVTVTELQQRLTTLFTALDVPVPDWVKVNKQA